MPQINSLQLGRDLSSLALSIGKSKRPVVIKAKDPGIPRCVSSDQLQLVGANLTGTQLETVGRLQEGIGRLRIVDFTGEPTGTGSATSISPNGLCLTSKHNIVPERVSFPELVSGLPQRTFFVDIPTIVPGTGNVSLETHEAEVIDYDPHIDVALIRIKYDDKDPHPFIPLGTEDTILGTPAYKIGHTSGAEHNLLSRGIITHTSQRNSAFNDGEIGCSECERDIRFVVSTNAAGFGDSGGVIIDETGKVTGLVTKVAYKPFDSTEIYVEAPRVHQAVPKSDVFSLSTSITASILPFLERSLGKRNLNKVLDGKEVVVTPKEAVKNRNSSRPSFIIISFELRPGE
jgi:hypothetical protein